MKFCLVLLLALLSGAGQAFEKGDRLATWTLTDQFGQPAALDEQTRLLLVASSRDAAELVDAAIKDRSEGYLEARDALYVADVSRMPRVITRLVMVPAMRSANYRILLDRDSQVAPERLGAEEILWLSLDGLEVRDRRLFDSSEALRNALEQQPQ